MSNNDGDDDLEDRKSDVWSMDEVRNSGSTTTEASDTSDTTDAKSGSTTSDDEDAPDTSDTSGGRSSSNTSDVDETSDTSKTSDTTDKADTEDTSDTNNKANDSTVEADGATVRQMAIDADSKGMVVRDLHNVNVYLYESVYQEMRVKYKELDAEYFAAHGEDLSKNKDFFNAVFQAGLQSPQLKEELEIE